MTQSPFALSRGMQSQSQSQPRAQPDRSGQRCGAMMRSHRAVRFILNGQSANVRQPIRSVALVLTCFEGP